MIIITFIYTENEYNKINKNKIKKKVYFILFYLL